MLTRRSTAQVVTIEEVSVSCLKEWKDNPRKNNGAVLKLAEVLKAHGQITPVVAWRENLTIYKGNTTWKALKSLGVKTIKVLFVDFPSEQAAIAYGIADNKSSEWSHWDDELLSKFLSDTGIRESSGFTEKEISMLDSVSITIEKVSPIDCILSAYSLLGETKDGCQHLVYIDGKEARLTDRRVYVTIPITGMVSKPVTGWYNLKKTALLHDLKYCETVSPITIPEFPVLPKSTVKSKFTVDGLGKFPAYSAVGTVRNISSSVHVTKDCIFATDGSIALIGNSRNLAQFTMGVEQVKIATALGQVTEVLQSEKWLVLYTDTGAVVYSATLSSNVPDIRKAIYPGVKFVSVDLDKLAKQVSAIVPVCKVEETTIELRKTRACSKTICIEVENLGFEACFDPTKLLLALSSFSSGKLDIGFINGQLQLKQGNFICLLMALRGELGEIPKTVLSLSDDTEDEVSKQFEVRGYGLTLTVSCLKSIVVKVKKIMCERGFSC